jgi:hypothetical protein
MAELGELARLIRSKNAGPFILTFDIMFDDKESYDRVVKSGVISREIVAQLYGTSDNEILIFDHDAALAIKVSIPRPFIQGAFGDGDMMGGQQYAPLVELEIP